MAAVHNQSSRQHPHSRLRTSSDPFGDPAPRPKKKPPPPPPKTSSATRMSVALPKSSPPNLTEAVRNTVTVHKQDNNPRHKANPSQTTGPVHNSRPRSHSDNSAHVTEKPFTADRPRSSGKSRNKKSSQHADVIDRLDFTGVGPMFHHDGPFDACAPSRNKHHTKAPMYAWGTIPDESPALRYGDGAYPSADVYKVFSNDYPEPPKKKVDAIAEAWGIHEPEPFEEFFAGGGSGRQESDTPASSIYNDKDSHSAPRNNPTVRRVKDHRTDHSARRSIAPPPQPIFADPTEIAPPESPPSSPGFHKRSKSFMHRIRKMRDAPNVPVGPDYDEPHSPSSPTDPSRPMYRSQNTFLGRFGGTPRANQLPVAEREKPEPFVLIEPQPNNKELPGLPTSTFAPGEDVPSQSYPENQMSATSSSPGDRPGRKASIMKKVGRVVRGAK